MASGNSDNDGIGTIWPHNLHISTACVQHLEKVFSNVRQGSARNLRYPSDQLAAAHVAKDNLAY